MAKKPESKMIDRDKYAYDPIRYTDASGKTRHSVGNGDALARAMLGMDTEAILKATKANGLGALVEKHRNNKKINQGHLRMLCGNALRALIRKGTSVVVNGVEIKKLDQKEPVLKSPSTPAERKKKAA